MILWDINSLVPRNGISLIKDQSRCSTCETWRCRFPCVKKKSPTDDGLRSHMDPSHTPWSSGQTEGSMTGVYPNAPNNNCEWVLLLRNSLQQGYFCHVWPRAKARVRSTSSTAARRARSTSPTAKVEGRLPTMLGVTRPCTSTPAADQAEGAGRGVYDDDMDDAGFYSNGEPDL